MKYYARLFTLINIAADRRTEREHRLIYLLQESTAVVEPVLDQNNPYFDAIFGSRAEDPSSHCIRYSSSRK